MSCLVVTAVLLVCLTTQGRSDFTGMDLLNMCGSKDKEAKSLCESWIVGFQAGVGTAEDFRKATNGGSVCLPKGFTGGQVILIVEKYMKENPKLLHFGANMVTFEALFEAFPCQK